MRLGSSGSTTPCDAQPAASDLAFLPLRRVIAPGRLGPLVVGMDAEKAVDTGLVEGPDPEATCGDIYSSTPEVAKQRIFIDFDHEEPHDLIGITVRLKPDGAPARLVNGMHAT